jgi:riboflavin synthase
MFTGIVTHVGTIGRATPCPAGTRLRIASSADFLRDVAVGDSIAVNGVCLTAVSVEGSDFEADVSPETERCAAAFTTGERVNLEKSLRLSDRLGGHLVSGHVDGVGEIAGWQAVGDNCVAIIEVPEELARYIARKGSVAVHGVSLTVNTVEQQRFSVNLIPHTLQQTSLRDLGVGDKVNIEVDMLARYAERLLEGQRSKVSG